MSFRKRLASVGLSAALVASLLATTAGSVFAVAHDNTGYLKDCVPASCSVVADGISTIVITNGTDTKTATGVSLYATISGATFAAAAGDFVLGAGVVTAADGAIITGAGDSITVRAPSAPGTATISIYEIPTGGGNATLEGTFAVTFYSATALAVSEANSVVKFVGPAGLCTDAALASNTADKALNPAAQLCVTPKDGNGSTYASATVSVTITPVGLVGTGASGTAQAASEAVGTNDTVVGSAKFGIGGSNIAGVATVAISVTVGTTTTAFAPKTFTFTGSLASLTATNALYSIATGAGPLVAVNFTAKDAAGNRLGTAGSTATASTGAPFTVGAIVETTPTANGTVAVTCGATAGSGTVTVKNGTVSSNAVTIVCAGAGATITAAFDKTSVAPGGTASFLATIKDAGGRPVADGTLVTAIANSGAVVDPTDGNATAATSNGVATFTFIAPATTGVATLNAFDISGVTGSAAASITVGAAAGTADSALGVTTSGPFSTSTKVQSVGKYVTFRFDFGATAAGKTVTILSATKTGTTWSSFTTLTARVANSSGVVYYYVRQSSAAWKSYRASESSSGAITPARQARWV